MFFEGGRYCHRITTGDAVELFGPGGYVGLYVPLPTALISVLLSSSPLSLSPADGGLFIVLRLNLGFEFAFVGMVQRGMVSQMIRVRFHYLTPGQGRRGAIPT